MTRHACNLALVRPPSVDSLANSLKSSGLPHQLRVEAARRAIAGNDHENAAAYAREIYDDLLQPVINGTGVIIHTNLGRSPLNPDRTLPNAYRYSNLEFDLANGRRGSRDKRVGSLISKYIGAESAIIVNNGAAAIFLVLAALAFDRNVVISRGELVEIGGGFRIPDVLESAGARLIEVGTTNKTRLNDYVSAAKNSDPALILKVHGSNYKMIGFTETVPVKSLKTIGLPVIFDIGSGLLDESAPWMGWPTPSWLKGEPGAKQTLESGADLVTFSGDKLLGGPQAGIIAGAKKLVDACARHPLYRALRPGNLTLEAMADTIFAYLDNRADHLPLWKMAKIAPGELKTRAELLDSGAVVRLKSTIGGGSLPGQEIDSYGIALSGDKTSDLRKLKVPVIARMEGPDTVIDLRTVDIKDDSYLKSAIRSLP
ncbi:MAG: L-seryl-tRNA(Sec) selenium transferase [Actinomycetota bacterium]|nr:MAG: L-seryl-tRNA(Sec) selenium transferase [Actinomycetota bacterium]